MATITLTSITLAATSSLNQRINIKYRKTSDPDIATSYTNAGFYYTNPSGVFLSPVVLSGLDYSTSYTILAINVCANSIFVKSFTTGTSPTTFHNARQHQVFTRETCTTGHSGTSVDYVVAANVYSSTISQADADNQAFADIAANGQGYADTHGSCIVDSLIGTLLVDYFNDTAADMSFYINTVGVAETGIIVASTANGGPLQYPNDGRDPSGCVLLSSDKLTPGPPVRRFLINMAYLISTYPAIDVFTFVMRGRSDSNKSCTGSYVIRNTSEGYMAMQNYSPSEKIPAVIGASTMGITPYSSDIQGGADGTVGTTVGQPVLQLVYTVSTNTLTATTF